MKEAKMKTPAAPKEAKNEKGALDKATATMMEVPSGDKSAKAALKKEEPKTYAKYKVALKENERQFLNFGHIKNGVKNMDFCKKFIAHHVAECFGIKLTDELFAKLEAKVKFDLNDETMTSKEKRGFAFNNKGMEGTAPYNDVMRILKQELGADGEKLSYEAVSITRLLLRKAMNTNPIVNDIQCVTLKGDKFLAANSQGDEFEDRGTKFSTGSEVLLKVNTFRSMKGKLYKETLKPE